jgi:hypothetical protein
MRTVAIRPTAAERALLDAALAYASALWRADAGGRLVASVIARRVCSSAAAAESTIARRLTLLAGGIDARDEQPRLPWEDDSPDADVADTLLARPGLADRQAEMHCLHHLRGLAASAAGGSSKLRSLRRLLSRIRESVLVFSEYRDVVEWCAAGVADLCRVAVLHGGLSSIERREAVDAFNDGRVRLLVATDAAGEGLNLHARCRLVVNLELPWSPLRVDQRAGRVDRIGQTRAVHIRHLVHRGSYEDLVLARLDARRRTADGDLGAVLVEGDAVAACVLGGAALPRVVHQARADASTDRTAGDAIRHTRRHATSASTQPAHVWIASRSRGERVSRTLVLLYSCEIADAEGRLVQLAVIALRVELPESRRRLTGAVVDTVRRSAAVHAALHARVNDCTVAARQALEGVVVRLDNRLAALHRAVGQRRLPPVQASLFDRRDEQRARARRTVVERWQSHLLARQRVVRSLASLTAGPPRLLAAWLGE